MALYSRFVFTPICPSSIAHSYSHCIYKFSFIIIYSSTSSESQWHWKKISKETDKNKQLTSQRKFLAYGLWNPSPNQHGILREDLYCVVFFFFLESKKVNEVFISLIWFHLFSFSQNSILPILYITQYKVTTLQLHNLKTNLNVTILTSSDITLFHHGLLRNITEKNQK